MAENISMICEQGDLGLFAEEISEEDKKKIDKRLTSEEEKTE